MSEPAVAADAALALDLRDVEIVYRVRGRDREVVRGVSFSIGRRRDARPGRRIRLREVDPRLSGDGLSPSQLTAGWWQAAFPGADVLRMDRATPAAPRQPDRPGPAEPTTALSPGMSVGDQVAEVLTGHGSRRNEAGERSRELFAQVGLADPGPLAAALSASALRRPAAARRHRDGARLRA